VKPLEKGSLLRSVLRALGMDKSFKSHLTASAPTDADEDLRQPYNFNVQAHIIAGHRKHELESQKAMMVSLSRHDRWKAGGPL